MMFSLVVQLIFTHHLDQMTLCTKIRREFRKSCLVALLLPLRNSLVVDDNLLAYKLLNTIL